MVTPPEFFNFASDVLDNWARQRPEAPGLWCVDARRTAETILTFRELSVRSRQAANVFRAAGVGRGARVLVMLPRVPQWWIAMLGLVRVGAIPIPTTLQITPRELAYRLETAEVNAVVADPKSGPELDSFAGARLVVGGKREGWVDFEARLKEAPETFQAEPIRAEEPGIIYFTSATTGEPKMVIHTQASYGLAHESTGKLWLDLQPDDIHWNISDVGWGKAAWSSFYGPWHAGACVFTVDTRGRFDPVSALETLSAYPITTWCAPPTALRMIVREDLSRWSFPKLRHCLSAGEPLNPEVITAWQKATGLTIHEGYGQTETVILIGNFRSLGHVVRPGSMGKPAPGFDVALLDDQLQELPHGQEGEIAIRLKPERPLGLFKEYWKSPAENAAHFKDGWYLTGDCAVRDVDGYYWFVGRGDDIIKSSGYRIGPFEVENALLEHESVLEAAVVGKPDALRGQIVKAYVVLRPRFEAGEELKQKLVEHCRRLVAPYKKPRDIEFVASLPKTISSKILRKDLRRRA